MPPSAKFTREEIVRAALDLVRTEGFDALTARALGNGLGSSARPIFTVFQSMDEVQQAVIDAAKRLYKTYIQQGLADPMPFFGVGKQYIMFANQEPKLFQLLFMREHAQVPDLSSVLPVIDENYEQILASVRHDYGVEGEAAKRLYQHLWIYSHGIATLCATGMCRFTAGEIRGMMKQVRNGLLSELQEADNHD